MTISDTVVNVSVSYRRGFIFAYLAAKLAVWLGVPADLLAPALVKSFVRIKVLN